MMYLLSLNAKFLVCILISAIELTSYEIPFALEIGNDACNGQEACHIRNDYPNATIADGACIGKQACQNKRGDVSLHGW